MMNLQSWVVWTASWHKSHPFHHCGTDAFHYHHSPWIHSLHGILYHGDAHHTRLLHVLLLLPPPLPLPLHPLPLILVPNVWSLSI